MAVLFESGMARMTRSWIRSNNATTFMFDVLTSALLIHELRTGRSIGLLPTERPLLAELSDRQLHRSAKPY